VRLVIAALALACLPTLAIGQAVSTAPLAVHEVLLEIQATGRTESTPNLARFAIPLMARAATMAQARSNNDALAQRATAAARNLGIAAEDIQIGRPGGAMGLIGNEAYAPATEGDGTPSTPAAQTGFDLRVMEIVVRDPSRYEQLRSALEQAGVSVVPPPSYELANDSAARRIALQDALSKAHADAENIAAAMSMRVARILRVSERTGQNDVGWSVEAAMRQAYGLNTSNRPVAATEVRINVDFALAPR
jgi:uncharacterized protein YggE